MGEGAELYGAALKGTAPRRRVEPELCGGDGAWPRPLGLEGEGEVAREAGGKREMLSRRRDFRPTWNLTVTERVAGNYYPINSAVAVRDARAQLTLVVDRAVRPYPVFPYHRYHAPS